MISRRDAAPSRCRAVEGCWVMIVAAEAIGQPFPLRTPVAIAQQADVPAAGASGVCPKLRHQGGEN